MGKHKMKVGKNVGFAQKKLIEKKSTFVATMCVPNVLIDKYRHEKYRDYFYYYIDYIIKKGAGVSEQTEDDIKAFFQKDIYNEVVNKLIEDNIILITD